MAHLIRQHMEYVDGEFPLFGDVEIDETYVGGKSHGMGCGRGTKNKTIVFGMLQRDGQVMTKIIPNCKKKTLHPIIEENVQKGSTTHTDEFVSYGGLDKNISNGITTGRAHARFDFFRSYNRPQTAWRNVWKYDGQGLTTLKPCDAFPICALCA